MLAALMLAPPSRAMLQALQHVADALVAVNASWIRSQLAEGRRPPSSLASSRPPWSPLGVRYRASHGAPVGTARIYQDGPTAMHSGFATCIDIAAYDAPASSLLLGVPLAVRVLPIDSRHDATQPLRCHAWLVNSNGDLVDPVASFAKEGA